MDWVYSLQIKACHTAGHPLFVLNYENDAIIIFFIVFLCRTQSLENCVCVLHNLTYQLETEMPSLFTKINALASYARNRSSPSDAGPIGCFSSQSQKLQQEVCTFTPSLLMTLVLSCIMQRYSLIAILIDHVFQWNSRVLQRIPWDCCGKCAKRLASRMLVFIKWLCIVVLQSVFDYPVMEDNNPKGTGWLFHSKALQMYLSLLSSSERDATLEASCGALQNLTANESIVRLWPVCLV